MEDAQGTQLQEMPWPLSGSPARAAVRTGLIVALATLAIFAAILIVRSPVHIPAPGWMLLRAFVVGLAFGLLAFNIKAWGATSLGSRFVWLLFALALIAGAISGMLVLAPAAFLLAVFAILYRYREQIDETPTDRDPYMTEVYEKTARATFTTYASLSLGSWIMRQNKELRPISWVVTMFTLPLALAVGMWRYVTLMYGRWTAKSRTRFWIGYGCLLLLMSLSLLLIFTQYMIIPVFLAPFLLVFLLLAPILMIQTFPKWTPDSRKRFRRGAIIAVVLIMFLLSNRYMATRHVALTSLQCNPYQSIHEDAALSLRRGCGLSTAFSASECPLSCEIVDWQCRYEYTPCMQCIQECDLQLEGNVGPYGSADDPDNAIRSAYEACLKECRSLSRS